jgi:hypothetical protein
VVRIHHFVADLVQADLPVPDVYTANRRRVRRPPATGSQYS